MNKIYICDTPFQVLNAYNLQFHTEKINENNIVDLCIVNQFRSAPELCEKLRKTGAFTHVFLIKRPAEIENKLLNYIVLFAKFICPRLSVRSVLSAKDRSYNFSDYQMIYDCYFTDFVGALLKINGKNCEFYLIEDGTGTYYGDIIKKSVGRKYYLLSTIFHRGTYLANPQKIYVNNPSMCRSTIPAPKVPLPRLDDAFLKLADALFDVSENYTANPVIWLMNALADYPNMQRAVDRMCEVVDEYKERITVRLHPRETQEWKREGFHLDTELEMWELKIPQIDIENTLIMGLFSTGQLTPKFMYDYEPWIMFTHKIYSDVFPEEMNGSIDILTADLKANYQTPKKILIPQTEQEMFAMIKRFYDKSALKKQKGDGL